MQLTKEQKEFILAHECEDVRATALRFARADLPLLLAQIAGRQTAQKKLPAWYAESDILYPPHLSLEQSSSEAAARYKAILVSKEIGVPLTVAAANRQSVERENNPFVDSSIVAATTKLPPFKGKNNRLADLTGGMGVDFSFLSPYFREALYVERDEELCRIAEHNFRLLGLEHATVRCTDAAAFLGETPPLDFIYLDPSRRDSITGRKRFRIEDCSPDLSELKPRLLEKSDRLMVKYSPMLDISLAVKSLGCVDAVHVVSVDNECKELLFLCSKAAPEEPLFTAVHLKKTGGKQLFSFTMAQERKASVAFAGEPGRYLYEPNVSILKAGAFKSVAERYHLQKLHINSHLYTSDELVADFPGRIFGVDTFFVPNKRNLKSFSQETKKANITVRNYPMHVAEIRRKTGLEEGGDTYLFATTLAGGQKVWIIGGKVSVD